MINSSTEAPITQNPCCAKFLLESRKNEFIISVSNHLKGILYEKKKVVYDIHSDNFTMFIYFGKRNTNCLDAVFTGKSNYYFGSMNNEEIKDEMANQKEYLKIESKRLSKFMIQDLEQHYGENYLKYVKLQLF